ncbi:hypothetical protein L2E82_06398 [Cichorium intybus]|uniref:Uncharacterized protein n=1 Tax=Cichorium intybus TaxID=13427 RepID=A0ACB9HAH5_CICIN|nr:hypothetical protein L2E82_06398 [Cichorium intybus]
MATNRSRIIILMATVAALAISASATEYTVGDAKGWAPGVDYHAWTFSHVFYVGDKLVFKYPPGKYNVLEVEEGGYETCSPATSPDKALSSGNDVVTLTTPGHKFFISTTKHQGKWDCEAGMKVLINNVLPRLNPGSGPAPPSTGKHHVVGDDKGWTLDVDYQAWANGKKFTIGDKLIFKYPEGKHNVFQAIDDTAFRECIIPPAQEALTSGHDIITLESPDTWFICGAGNHCQMGMKFFVHASEAPSKPPAIKGGRKLVPTKLL